MKSVCYLVSALFAKICYGEIMKKFLGIVTLCLLLSGYANSNILTTGYKDVKFGMNLEQLTNLVKNNNGSICPVLNRTKCSYPNASEYYIEGLYEFDLLVHFTPDRLDEGVIGIKVIFFKDYYKSKFFVNDSYNIEKFENVRKILNKKYTLLQEPSQLSVDNYNKGNSFNGNSIFFEYITKSKPKFIVHLELTSYRFAGEEYEGGVWYSHPKYTKKILKRL